MKGYKAMDLEGVIWHTIDLLRQTLVGGLLWPFNLLTSKPPSCNRLEHSSNHPPITPILVTGDSCMGNQPPTHLGFAKSKIMSQFLISSVLIRYSQFIIIKQWFWNLQYDEIWHNSKKIMSHNKQHQPNESGFSIWLSNHIPCNLHQSSKTLPNRLIMADHVIDGGTAAQISSEDLEQHMENAGD